MLISGKDEEAAKGLISLVPLIKRDAAVEMKACYTPRIMASAKVTWSLRSLL